MRKIFIDLFLLFALTLLAWFIARSFSYYIPQLIALVIILYIFYFNARKHKADKSRVGKLEGYIFTFIILLVVFATGSAQSPVFFLIYFLIFGISFIIEPYLSLLFSLFLSLFLISSATAPEAQAVFNSLSIIFISPMSTFFGKLYLNSLADKKRVGLYKNMWQESQKHLEVEETDVLLWLATKLSPGLIEIIDRSSLILSKVDKLTESQRKDVRKIRKIALGLLRDKEKLQKKVDIETDER